MKKITMTLLIILGAALGVRGEALSQSFNGSTRSQSDARLAGAVLSLNPDLVYQFCRSQCGPSAACDPNCNSRSRDCVCSRSILDTLAGFTAFLVTSPSPRLTAPVVSRPLVKSTTNLQASVETVAPEETATPSVPSPPDLDFPRPNVPSIPGNSPR